MRVVVALAFAFSLALLSACSDSDVPGGTARGIDADIRASREAGATLSNLGIYDGPNMYDSGR
jgi:hypothetical protein